MSRFEERVKKQGPSLSTNGNNIISEKYFGANKSYPQQYSFMKLPPALAAYHRFKNKTGTILERFKPMMPNSLKGLRPSKMTSVFLVTSAAGILSILVLQSLE